MVNEEKLLCSIGESADMATDSLNKVIHMTDDEKLIHELENQCNAYKKYYIMAAEILREMGK